MTVQPHSGGAVAPYDPNDLENLGLEDVGASDLTMPRISINHGDGTFKNNLTGEEVDTLRCVILGIIKQRVMWDSTVDDGDKPMCKSPDHENGFPNLNYDGKTPPNKQFPWARSNFDAGDFSAEDGVNGLVTLPCASCIFKEWDKGDWKQPPCSEQHTYPLLYQTEDGGLMPAIFSVQKTGIKPSRTYLNAFVQGKKPMFTVWTEIRLTQQSRGTVKYSVPTFRKKEETDRNSWAEFGDMYRSARAFIRQPPRNDDYENDGTVSDNTNKAPEDPTPAPAATAQSTVKAATNQTKPTSASARTGPTTQSVSAPVSSGAASTTATDASSTSSEEDDDNLPF